MEQQPGSVIDGGEKGEAGDFDYFERSSPKKYVVNLSDATLA